MTAPRRGLRRVSPGRRIALNGIEWTVESVEAELGRLVLSDGAGRVETRSFRWLVNHPDLRLMGHSGADVSHGAPCQPRSLADSYHLLAQDPANPRSTMPRLLRHLPTRDDLRWGKTWHMLAHDASPRLRRQVDQTFRSELSSDWIRQGAPTLPIARANSTQKLFAPTHTLNDLGLAPEYIPQTLPVSWLLAATLGDTDARLASNRYLRRVLPVHLVQAISCLNFLEAAAFLGIPVSWTTQEPRRIKPLVPHRDLKDHDLPTTLKRLARHVLDQEKVNYQARRTQFATWHLDDATWHKLCRHHGPCRGRKPTDRTREAASAFVWSRVTGSEFSLAPVFQPPISPPDRQLSGESPQMKVLRNWEQRRRYMSYRELVEALEALAIQITRAGTQKLSRTLDP